MLTRSRLRSACFAVMVLGGLTAASSMGGCSSDDETPKEAGAALVCPVSIADVGKACAVEGKSCPTGYSCGAFSQQAQCVCAGGHFACTDQAGNDIVLGTPPTCIPQGNGNDARCPATEQAADGKLCGDAGAAGLQCRYPGQQCKENPPGQPNQDVCQCVALPAGGLAFKCEPNPCNPSADASDVPVDSGADVHDAATIDAQDAGAADASQDGG
jgi:hypothetical protein